VFGRRAFDTPPRSPSRAEPPRREARPEPSAASTRAAPSGEEQWLSIVRDHLLPRINATAALSMPRAKLMEDIGRLVSEIATNEALPINLTEQRAIAQYLLDDMVGIGPLEPLLADETVADIMVNGPGQIYVERSGRLELTEARFRDAQHVVRVAQRIAASVGRHVDESTPTCDARLIDGSRVNIVLPPVAIDGACISIRKFSKHNIDLQGMVERGSMSSAMAKTLEIAAACRLNIVVSGGTGSGKTTLLNALSRLIDARERIVTIEDAAELQLRQPHVVRLETRPANTEGSGEITQRELVKNALRMRPDRIILGETRGSEAFDVLQAMNTGHDGSMTTIHANSPRDAITRLESMVLMSAGNLPLSAIRTQIASAINLIVQVERMRDGVRRVQKISELVGQEGEAMLMQDLFAYEIDTNQFDKKVAGSYRSMGFRPKFLDRAAYYGLDEPLLAATR
jgi:pilus assembly protein CpaF